MGVNIKEIAQMAKVSHATVSRVVHGNGYVSDEVRERVQKIINEYKYVPNMVAKGLKNKRLNMIGHILPATYTNPFYAEIAHGVDFASIDKGYHVLTLFSYSDPERENQLIDELISRMVDGIIFTSVSDSKNIEKVLNLNIPVVVIERIRDYMDIDMVLVDELRGSIKATNYLINNGHKKIAFIGIEPSGKIYEKVEDDRYNGYINALNTANIKVDKKYIKFVNEYQGHLGYEKMMELLEEKADISAVFVSSDVLAAGVLQALYKAGKKIPDDISVIGFDDSLASIYSPPLTSVSLPMGLMGKTAVDLVIERILNKDMLSKIITLQTSIKERESVMSIG